jgi:plasmid stabilization system protein ParE
VSGYRLTPRAVDSLAEIFAWTIHRFGATQAATYRDALIRRCAALADGRPPHGRSCAALLPDQPAAQDLRYLREGRHFIVFQRSDPGLIVIDFVHERRALPALLRQVREGS